MTRYLSLLLLAGAIFLLTACHKSHDTFEPKLSQPKLLEEIGFGKAPFPPLTQDEKEAPYGKEWLVGKAFAMEGDYYRALTSFKRGLILTPPEAKETLFRFRYAIFLSYYHAGKYSEAVETFQRYRLEQTPSSFQGASTLFTAAYHAFLEIGDEESAQLLLSRVDEKTKERLVFFWAVHKPSLESLEESSNPSGRAFYQEFCREKKSPRTARLLNAVLPGAGYFYVGQKQTAATSFALNAIFLYTSYQLFDRGYTAMGIFVLSLESGWYFGGINGAGEAACEYNEHIYREKAHPLLKQERSFPILNMEYTF